MMATRLGCSNSLVKWRYVLKCPGGVSPPRGRSTPRGGTDVIQRICSIGGCQRRPHARGWCGKHYQRWVKHGDPNYQRPTAEERFWSNVVKTETCWLWDGTCLPSGYGRIHVGSSRVSIYAHRYAYELLVGPIPEGLTIDHVKDHGCTSKACVKAIADEFGPAHLEPVTQRVNNRRGNGWSGTKARQTHCKRGHPFNEANTYVYHGMRNCRTCRKARKRHG